MPLPIGQIVKAAKAAAPKAVDAALKAAPGVAKDNGPQAALAAGALAKTRLSARRLRKQAHEIAWECNGRVGQVHFPDGVRRWVIVKGNSPLRSLPPYEDGDLEKLAHALKDVDFDRCMTAPVPANQRKRLSLRAAG